VPAFTTYTIFGLSDAGVVLFVERLEALAASEAIDRASRRLAECHRVEVWAESVCVHRETRRR
jgi:hypothetical protein